MLDHQMRTSAFSMQPCIYRIYHAMLLMRMNLNNVAFLSRILLLGVMSNPIAYLHVRLGLLVCTTKTDVYHQSMAWLAS